MRVKNLQFRKRTILLAAAFAVLLGLFHLLDVRIRYGLNLPEYYRYSAPLSEAERSIIREKPIIVGISSDPPLSFTNEYNNYNSGIIVDYLSQIGIELGGNVLLKVLSADARIAALEAGSVDVIVGEAEEAANAAEGEKPGLESDGFLASLPLCVVKMRVYVPIYSQASQLRDLAGKTLVVLESDDAGSRITAPLRDEYGIRTVAVDNIYQAFALIARGDAEGFAGEDMEAAHFLSVTNRGANYRPLGAVLGRSRRTLIVSARNADLLTIFNKGIVELKKKNLIAQTQYRWLGDFDPDALDLRYIDTVYKVTVGVVLLFAAFTGWNYVITKRVNLRTRELSESREELRLIIDSINSGLMVIDSEGRIAECNDAINRMIGLPREQTIGAPIDAHPALSPFWRHTDPDSPLRLEHSYFYVARQKYARDKSLLVVEDYTEKYLSEKRARQEAKMVAVGQLSAGLAHEIRNPLGLIRSYSYIIAKNELDDVSRHAVHVIGDSVKRINNLIENLLRFSRLSNEDMRETDVGALVRMIDELVRADAARRGIEIESEIVPADASPVLVNEEVLRMVLINLINNSIDSFEDLERPRERKRIRLEIRIGRTELRLTLTDNGRGIERGRLEKIFDPFYTTKEKGTGLGLYLIGTEIYNNDGTISVESEPDVGTTFTITLPINGGDKR